MNSLLIYKDELSGFLKSKVFVILVVGLPLLVGGLRLAQPNIEGMSFFVFTAILIASIGGTLGSVLLSTAITSERSRHVYDLFLIRPVGRASLLLGKYFAALSALLFTAVVALGFGLLIDALTGRAGAGIVAAGIEPVVLSLAGIAVACSSIHRVDRAIDRAHELGLGRLGHDHVSDPVALHGDRRDELVAALIDPLRPRAARKRDRARLKRAADELIAQLGIYEELHRRTADLLTATGSGDYEDIRIYTIAREPGVALLPDDLPPGRGGHGESCAWILVDVIGGQSDDPRECTTQRPYHYPLHLFLRLPIGSDQVTTGFPVYPRRREVFTGQGKKLHEGTLSSTAVPQDPHHSRNRGAVTETAQLIHGAGEVEVAWRVVERERARLPPESQ